MRDEPESGVESDEGNEPQDPPSSEPSDVPEADDGSEAVAEGREDDEETVANESTGSAETAAVADEDPASDDDADGNSAGRDVTDGGDAGGDDETDADTQTGEDGDGGADGGLTKTSDDDSSDADHFEDVPLGDRPAFGPKPPREHPSPTGERADSSEDDETAPTDDEDGQEVDDDADARGAGEDGDDAESEETDDEGEDEADEDENETTEPDDEDGVNATETATPEAKTDGHGHPDSSQEKQEPTYPDPDEDVGGISTPPDDEEMPLTDHIEEMIMRLAVVLLVGSAATAIALLGSSQGITVIWDNVFPSGVEQPPHVYGPLELWLTRIKVAALAGIMVAIPMLVYQCYLFMRPGLYPHERKYYLAAVPTSVVLAGIGMLFSFIVVLPILFEYFTFYSEGSADIAYALGETFNLIITLTGFLAVVFQIPLFVILAVLMGVTTRTWLTEKRLYFWAAFFGLSFMFTVDPTLMAPIIVGIVMIILFEGTLLLLKWAGQE